MARVGTVTIETSFRPDDPPQPGIFGGPPLPSARRPHFLAMGRASELFPPAPVLNPRASILAEVLECIARGPQVCLLTGPPGIGKTYLATEAQKQLGLFAQMAWAKGVPEVGG